MKIEPFAMERMQSTWENLVDYNLSESGVHPLTLTDLLSDPEDRDLFYRTELGYSQSNGTLELRSLISAIYPGATTENITVTTGTAEANFIAIWRLVEPGDEVMLMTPNYMQIWGLVRGFGAEAKPFHLVEDRAWAPDLDQLERGLSARTKLIAICNPNNPTGAVLSESEMERIVEAARSAGAWLLADEVYRGAELNRTPTPSFWGRYEKLIVTSGLSKAYGLPGLRIGWLATTPEVAAAAWGYHDYTTIGPSPLTDLLARIALRPEIRERILERTRSILRANYPIISTWVASRDGFSLVDPQAGAIAYVRYGMEVGSVDLVERLRREKSVLIVAGEHFLMNNYLRIGYGGPADRLRAGLGLLNDFLDEIA
jgi:aspartate/methionine/tyrosine aminotransferase